MTASHPVRAMIFDTDGVVTRTTAAHFAAWKRLFDDFLASRSPDSTFDPFTDEDYRRDVDGKPRYDGVASFLATRGIDLPWGDPSDPQGDTSVCALGNRKDEYFLTHIRTHGVAPFPTTVRFVRALRAAGLPTGVISASRNCREVLRAANVEDLFDTRVDGIDAEQLHLAGKPEPDVFVEAARRLGVEPSEAGIVEDATAGVEAGRRGHFGLVVGVDRTAHPEGLADADMVVPDLGDLDVVEGGRIVRRERPDVRVDDLLSALADGDVVRRLENRKPAVFLDYDGTLTPIVARPEMATLPEATLDVLDQLGQRCPVGIISGRDLDDVRAMVPASHLWFAGSHGLDILSPDGRRDAAPEAMPALPHLDEAERELKNAVTAVPEAWVERKRFAIAVHFRQTPPEYEDELARIVAKVAAEHPTLRTTGGKMILELRPDIAWDKGKALARIMEVAGLDSDGVLPVYIGDDLTDEDALLAVRARGLGIVVGSGGRQTAAHDRLDDTEAVTEFLARLIDHVDRLDDDGRSS